jgi:histone H3/H4
MLALQELNLASERISKGRDRVKRRMAYDAAMGESGPVLKPLNQAGCSRAEGSHRRTTGKQGLGRLDPMLSTVWSTDTVNDVAESVGLQNLDPEVAQTLASDVEYRLHEIIQEAVKFMRHAKRTILSPADINNALRVLNVEVRFAIRDSMFCSRA